MISIRKIGVISRTYRHLSRYRQILAIFLKYGFEDLIERLKIDQYIEIGLQLILRKERDGYEKLTRPERARMAFEELGPTYIKFAQALSTRPDLIPEEFLLELSKLQDKVPPFDSSHTGKIIDTELGTPLGEIFEEFPQEPIASASIGQVYRARLKNGEEVAVKVQRPGIQKVIEVDLEIMLHIATLMERNIEEMAFYNPVKVIEEFARSIEKEIDYTIEATNMERVAGQFLGDSTIYIPKVFREKSSHRVLIMEYIEGIKISELNRLEAEGLDRKTITERGADFCLSQIFDHGFFHADPHPGNIFVLPGNVICLLDFGMTGYVDQHTREDFVDLVDSIVHNNESKATRVLLKLTSWETEPDIRSLERDVADFMGKHLFKPLKDIQFSKLMQDLLGLVSLHNLKLPPNILLMMKTLGEVEGVAHMLNPEFDMVSQTAPFIEKVKLARFRPWRIAGDIMNLGSLFMQFSQRFPQDLLEISRLIRNQNFSVKFEHKGLENMLATHDQISNRLSFSIIIAALLIGSALIVISGTPPLVYGISLIGIIGFLAAAVMGIWLLVAILRKGRL